jgi:hypothetical protein
VHSRRQTSLFARFVVACIAGSLPLLVAVLAPSPASALPPGGTHPLLGAHSPLGSTTRSTNWAGYAAVAGGANPASFSSVTATWVQPAVPSSGSINSYADFWVGLDGVTSPTVEQIGTESYSQGGRVGYDAWYELYPQPPVSLRWSPRPGDTISASVTQTSSGSFTLSLTDQTTGLSFTRTQTLGATGTSAEIIAEAPYLNGVLPLAKFGLVRFTGCAIDGSSIAAHAGSSINMISRSGRVLAKTSALGPDGASFSVTTDFTPPTTRVPADANRWHNRPVTLTFVATDETGGTGVAYTGYSTDGGTTWTQASSVTIPAPANHSNDGRHRILFRSEDGAGNWEAVKSCWVGIDTRPPTPVADRRASARRGGVARLLTYVSDPRPGSPTATVTIRIRTLAGRLRKTLVLRNKPVDKRLVAQFRCQLERGTYRFFVYVTDAAGNQQTRVAVNTLRVW